MRKRVSHLLLLLVFEVNAALAAPIGLVQRSFGDVWIYSRTERARHVKSGEGFESGISIATGPNSGALLRFQDGQIVVLQSDSLFRVKSFVFNSQDAVKNEISLELVTGGMRSVTGEIGRNNRGNWQLATPSATVTLSGTDFLAVVAQGLYAHVSTGAITLTNGAGTATVAAGSSAFVASNGAAPLGTSVIPDGLFAELDAAPINAGTGAAA